MGRARWASELIAEQAVKRKIVGGIGRETIRVLLRDHFLKTVAGENVVRSRPRR